MEKVICARNPVRARTCKTPRHGREETRWRLFVQTDMSPCYRNSPMHTKTKDQERTRKVLFVLITLLVASQNLHACTNKPTKRAQAQETLTHAAGWMLHRMQWHWVVRSQRRGRRYRRRRCAGGNTLSSITQTHRTKKTRHALNARHRIAACNAGSMRVNPCPTPPFPCTACATAVWMRRTCERSRDGARCCQGACKQDPD